MRGYVYNVDYVLSLPEILLSPRIIDMRTWIFPADVRWTVLKYVGINECRLAMWWCKCSCSADTAHLVSGANLRNGQSKSCGCLGDELITIHGFRKEKLY